MLRSSILGSFNIVEVKSFVINETNYICHEDFGALIYFLTHPDCVDLVVTELLTTSWSFHILSSGCNSIVNWHTFTQIINYLVVINSCLILQALVWIRFIFHTISIDKEDPLIHLKVLNVKG